MIRDIIRQASIPEVREKQPNARDNFLICDAGGLLAAAKDTSGLHLKLDGIEHGKPELTAAAEKYLHKFEDDIFVGHGWRVRDEVVGAVPNVPAMLAGQPASMRLRTRTKSAQAPLTVLFELTGSSGTMHVRHERGAAMLALVRLLSNERPVDLWTLTTYGTQNEMAMVACNIDTRPLDTARAAAMLMDQDTLVAISWVSAKQVRQSSMMTGGWAYNSPNLERTWSGEALRRLISPSSELLFIPAAYLSDNFYNPEKWVRDMLKKYGMGAVQREDD